MRNVSERLQFILSVDSSGAVKGFQDVGKAADKELGKAEGKLDKLGGNMTKYGAGAMAFAGVAFAGFKKLADGASDLNESLNAVDVTFGEASAGILELSQNASKAAGLSRKDFNSLAVQFAAFAKTVAGDGGDVVKTVDDMTRRAADFASVMNLEVADAARIFQSGLAGQSEPLRKFGIDMSAATVAAYAVANGISASAASMTEAEKVTARYGLLMESTAFAQDDFTNTSDGLANSQRILAADLENLKDEIGMGLLPIFQKLVGFTADLVGAFNNLSPEVKAGVGTFAGLATAAIGAAGALSFTAGQFIKHRSRFQAMFTTVGVDGVRSFTNLGKAMTGVGVGVSLAIVAYQIYNTRKKQAVERTKDLASALRDESEGQNEALAALAENDAEVKRFVSNMDLLGVTTAELSEYVNSGTGKVAEYAAVWAEADESANSLMRQLLKVYELMPELDSSTGDAAVALMEFVKESNRVRAAEQERANLLELTSRVTGEATDATEDLTDATQDATQAFEDKRKKLQEAKQALRDLIDSQRAAFDSTYALEQATWKAEDAIKGYVETTEDSQATERDKIESQREAEQALIDLAAQTVKTANDQRVANGDSAFSAEEMAARTTAALDGIIAYLGPDDPLRKRLTEYRDQLEDIPEVHETKILLDTVDAHRQLRAYRDEYLAAMQVMQTMPTPQGGRKNARGTAFSPGGVTLVGEEGPELVDLPTGARVYDADQTRRMTTPSRQASGGGGGAMTINVTALDPQQAADAVVEAIQQYERRNGSGWRS
jgi:hypothetical protein